MEEDRSAIRSSAKVATSGVLLVEAILRDVGQDPQFADIEIEHGTIDLCEFAPAKPGS